ncbi:membrane protein [Pectobacterium phage vB_PcaM_CBB]|uniref:Putative membrane protein n=1 Tax=Pectobacterium phage vB_PcaM_CBB TaxID=2772511 RepID=A0A1L2CVQ0_9CAUD|nr:membrane protein [Pectobacterium phage vB_PcaM_CBB]AMM44102.1 putative membrane protein [Pectobacterium phage vB_PcaM_CBB]
MEIIAVLSIIVFIIMFVGYWTYADYYTNLKIDIRRMYWVTHVIMYGIAAECILLSMGEPEPLKAAIKACSAVIGYGTIIIVASSFGAALILFFGESRKYFGRKRNKL